MDIISSVGSITPVNPNRSEVFNKPQSIINEAAPGQKTFAEFVSDAVNAVDQAQKTAEQKTEDLVMGKTENVHDVMIAMQKAQLSFNMMVEVRNKVVEAYKELSRMPI